MLRRTHLAIGLAVALHFVQHVSNQFLFIAIVMVATVLPDIDSGFSAFGKNWFAKPLQVMVSHRGFLHSYTFCLPASIALALIYPVAALPFFLGYSFHLFTDAFTVQGIRPFWPLKNESKGPVKTGGIVDDAVFWTMVILNVLLIISFFI
jgi:membrane-bound metal-dependent hydrolase YbcI (DUF457 family)